MLNKLFKDYNIVLGSNSPRRKQYLTDLGFTFTVRASDIDESYPEELVREQITDYIAKAKADAIEILHDNEIIITSDTTVWNNDTSLGKPESRDEAYTMLKSLCGHEHEVISSVCLKSKESVSVFHCITKVSFSDLSDEALYFYIDQYKPYDKAGAYGIQEWIGLVGIDKIDGSYTNIVGLPTKELVEELLKFIKK
ncbi:septum formation protein Maf [Myroides odoratimimus CCUG 12901]|uniref:dTTP/UTP pyrophosphatase n=1 Tax=Myroides odoratimimus CCUG 10230 TaxID=883150 RepID=A0ABP2N9S8_9FLAO|nr:MULTISPECIES: Maf family nucleotide pyrophosphatase [Myroides]EHO07661.1 septum formation protein Maf [Myroides odoratimimus CCUG 10230]EHO11743.1 septum formation protein Maf [Myroides odoratimimus CCUG 12901]MDM1397287.1 septum formation protein Maf [Myroides odoratimimus]MDM1520419.1 septum formation protein Maf [Myroides odoratimimus]STZ47940.1 Septum formation protein Maf [Myroides odoratimimus]